MLESVLPSCVCGFVTPLTPWWSHVFTLGRLGEYYCWNSRQRQLTSHIPCRWSLTNEDTLSILAVAAFPPPSLCSPLIKTSPAVLTTLEEVWVYERHSFLVWFISPPVFFCRLCLRPTPRHLNTYLSSSPSSSVSSFLYSSSTPLPSPSSLSSSWIQSLFTLPDHSTDSHPWNDAIKVPTGAQSVMLTHAKPPQRAERSTESGGATGKTDGGEGRWKNNNNKKT